jgi:ABC-2 type transport system ATP-binding protein
LIRQRRGRQTIVISSHNLSDIELLCDAVAFIERGRLVRQDTLDRIIQRSHRLTYVLAAATPVESLRQAAPEVEWQTSADGRELTAAYAEPWTAESLNAHLVPLLLASGAGLLAIRRGSDLETEYLSLTPPLPPEGRPAVAGVTRPDPACA